MIPWSSSSQIISLDFVTSTTVSNAGTVGTITIPASAQVGDIAFLFDLAEDSASIPVTVTPTGWSSINSNLLSPCKGLSSRRILTAGEPGSAITGMNGGVSNLKTMLIFRPVGVTPVFSQDINGQFTAAAPTNQVIDPSVAPYSTHLPALILCQWGTATTDGAISGDTMTSSDATISNGTHQKVRYKIYSAAPASETLAMGDAGAHNLLQSSGHYFGI